MSGGPNFGIGNTIRSRRCAGKQQADVPWATKQAAVEMFNHLQKQTPDAKLSNLTAKVCKKSGVG